MAGGTAAIAIQWAKRQQTPVRRKVQGRDICCGAKDREHFKPDCIIPGEIQLSWRLKPAEKLAKHSASCPARA